jgi:hypothetical protein
MPWCEECAKYWTPNSMNEDGTCPECGSPIAEAHEHAQAALDDEKAPSWWSRPRRTSCGASCSCSPELARSRPPLAVAGRRGPRRRVVACGATAG